MSDLNIVIINTQTVPSSGAGAASVNRILSYAKGLVNNGNCVRILSTASHQERGWQKYEGVPVRHLGGTPKEGLAKIIGFVGTLYRLIKALSKEKKDVLVFVTSNYPLIILLELYCKITGTKIVNERSEYPFVLMTKNKIKRIFAPLYTNTAYKMLDGMILMTKPLMEYYTKKCRKNCKFIEVPMTVDVHRFSGWGGGIQPCHLLIM